MKKWIRLSLLILIFCLTGCGGKDNHTSKEYLIYDVDKDENKVNSYSIHVEETETKDVLQALFRALKQNPETAGYKSAIPEGVDLIGYSLNEDQLVLDFSVEYHDLNPIQEVLSRAAVVRTLCQVEGIRFVSFKVEGEPLLSGSGYQIGLMNAEQFVDNAGDEINSTERADLTLYFADKDGSHLVPHT